MDFEIYEITLEQLHRPSFYCCSMTYRLNKIYKHSFLIYLPSFEGNFILPEDFVSSFFRLVLAELVLPLVDSFFTFSDVFVLEDAAACKNL